MAVTSIWPIKGRVDKVIAYVRNPEKVTEEYLSWKAALHVIDGVVQYAADDTKTERMEYVTGVNCAVETATEEFLLAKRMWHKEDGRLCYHGYQSFKPGEVDARTAHEISVELARRLWGDRFQVVVATHCNTGTYHSHFVINSVSYKDGYKFYNKKSDYRQMRSVSDELCREYGLSVIEDPQRRKKDYGLRKAEESGKLTHSQMIRNDLDRAVRQSLYPWEFYTALKDMGYVIREYGANGYPLKHPTITPPGGKKNFRLDSLGEGYDLRSLINRVNANKYADPPFQAPQKRFYRAKALRKQTVKLTGLRALYFKYCCKLGIIQKHPERQKQVSWQLREDLIKLDRYIAEAKLLLTNKIETTEDLAAYKTGVEQRIGSLEHQRAEYRNLLRRIRRAEDAPTDEALRATIRQISDELKQARKELEYCADIAQRSEQVRSNLLALRNDREELKHGRRSSGFSRQPSRDDYER